MSHENADRLRRIIDRIEPRLSSPTVTALREIADELAYLETFSDNLAHLTPEEYGASEGTQEGCVEDFVKALTETVQKVIDNPMTPRQCREPLQEAMRNER